MLSVYMARYLQVHGMVRQFLSDRTVGRYVQRLCSFFPLACRIEAEIPVGFYGGTGVGKGSGVCASFLSAEGTGSLRVSHPQHDPVADIPAEDSGDPGVSALSSMDARPCCGDSTASACSDNVTVGDEAGTSSLRSAPG